MLLCVQYVRYMEKKVLWCIYWLGLGILSSFGLGTGLHTFLLYLVSYLFALNGGTHVFDHCGFQISVQMLPMVLKYFNSPKGTV